MKTPAVIALSSIVAVLATGNAAAAKPDCGDAVVKDWSDGRIEGVYAPACYGKAIDSLPEDVRAYSTAVDDISQALRARIRLQTRRAAAEPDSSAAPGADRSRRMSVREPARAEETEPVLAAADVAETTSLPLPLLSAAGVALVLGIAGSAGLIARRRRGRLTNPPARPVGEC